LWTLYTPYFCFSLSLSGAASIVEGKPDVYDGEFTAGMRHGTGKYAFGNPDAKGAYYEGAFKGTDVEVRAAATGFTHAHKILKIKNNARHQHIPV
jgi:hypothetical protein